MSDFLQGAKQETSAGAEPAQLTISDLARSELAKLMESENAFLRVWVEAGGCSGLSYQAAIDETASPFDIEVYDDGTLKVVTDKQSRTHVEGLQIDYSDDLVQAGFRFINPRATSSCGCGQSFCG